MSIRKRIAAMGAAAVMAASMCAMGASADFTMTYRPDGKLQGYGTLVNSKEYKYKLSYKLADLDCSATVTMPKKCGSGYIDAWFNYFHGSGAAVKSNICQERQFNNSDSGKYIRVKKPTIYNVGIKKNKTARADFRIKTGTEKVKSRTFNGCMDVRYHNL